MKFYLYLVGGLGLCWSSCLWASPPSEGVVLLHGIARTGASMESLSKAIKNDGYDVLNITYDSRHSDLINLARETSPALVSFCRDKTKCHLVTHSMGGILARYILAEKNIPQVTTIVMLAPPNQGSEIVDAISGSLVYQKTFGPAGQQLGTQAASQAPQLPSFIKVGIIAGDKSINPITSLLWLPGPDDGAVTVSRTWRADIDDFKVVSASHTFMMNNKDIQKLTIRYLHNGRFE